MKALSIGLAAFLLFSFTSIRSTADIPVNARSTVSSLASTSSLASASSFTSAAVRSVHAALTMADSSRFNHLYEELNLDNLSLSREAFHRAVRGFLSLTVAGAIQNPDVLSIVDFSLPSTQKRLFIIDMLNGRLLFNTLVAHGRNSGTMMATRFSNRKNSFMSSLGFYLTGDPFEGAHGYSLRLQGLERGWNDHAFSRRIIIHAADYVSPEHIEKCGYLGRSEGCPAVPENLSGPIIDEIKGGSCLFLFAPNMRFTRRAVPFS